jgi:hypothetical protein
MNYTTKMNAFFKKKIIFPKTVRAAALSGPKNIFNMQKFPLNLSILPKLANRLPDGPHCHNP